jgi:hypothetical protein
MISKAILHGLGLAVAVLAVALLFEWYRPTPQPEQPPKAFDMLLWQSMGCQDETCQEKKYRGCNAMFHEIAEQMASLAPEQRDCSSVYVDSGYHAGHVCMDDRVMTFWVKCQGS